MSGAIPPCDAPGCELSGVWLLRWLAAPEEGSASVLVLCDVHVNLTEIRDAVRAHEVSGPWSIG